VFDLILLILCNSEQHKRDVSTERPFAPWYSVLLQQLVVAQLVKELLSSTAENVIDLDTEACGENILSFKEISPYPFICY